MRFLNLILMRNQGTFSNLHAVKEPVPDPHFLPKETLDVTMSEKGRKLEAFHTHRPLLLFLWP